MEKNVGVDAGCLGVKDKRLKAGVYQVALNLLKELAQIDTKNLYRLYSFYPIEKKVLNQLGERMKNIVLRPERGWFTIRLPLELKLHPVDVFLGLGQALPSSTSHNIVMIYDLAFEHYPEFYPGSYNKLKKNTKIALQRANQIITISRSTKKDLMRFYNVESDKIPVSYPGVSKNFSPNGAKFELGTPYFLFVGSLKKKKNILRILKGFSEFLKKSRQEYKLLLVGGDLWFDQKIPETIASLSLKEKVLMTGFVKDKDLPKYYRGAVAFVSPSLYEGGGLTHLEAMACGTPVVAGNISSMPEIVGKAGILVNPKNEIEIGEAMLKTVADKKLHQDLIKRGLERARKFSWQKFARQVLMVVNNLGSDEF